MGCDVTPMSLRLVCPQGDCGYIAYGDDEKEVRRDLQYHLMDIHGINRIPEEARFVEDLAVGR
jgi:hypothetical protein